METSVTRHISSENPRVLVVDGSKVVRRIIDQLLHQDLPGVTVLACSTGEEAKAHLQSGVIDLVTTALRLPDMDGLELARYTRENSHQAYIPIVVVSGDVQERLMNRDISSDVTDYFDKSLGLQALSTFIRGYIRPEGLVSGEVLYVEDSRVVAVATRRMMERHGFKVNHVVSVEDAIDILEQARFEGRAAADIILTDVYLKGGMTGGDLLDAIRGPRFGYSKGEMPILVMTGDDNAANQTALLRAGANDLVQKPTEERLLITKLGFQLRVGQALRAQSIPTP